MRRPWLIWPAFGLCVALAAVAMARVGATALRLERAEAQTRRQAAMEESLQLALWRIDSALAPLIADESSRPYFAYNAFYPAERAYTCMFAEIQRGDVLMPSPLLTDGSPWIRLHFQFGPDGRLTSPEVPSGNMRDLAEARYCTPERIEQLGTRLAELARRVNQINLAAALPADEPRAPEGPNFGMMAQQSPQIEGVENPQKSKASNEFMMRSRNAQRAQYASPERAKPLSPASTPVIQGPLRALWLGPTLVLARRVRVSEGTFLQGCWLDWESIQTELSASVADLLLQPTLVPVRTPADSSPTRMLAALPARLVAGPAPEEPQRAWSPVGLSLAIAWGCLAMVAVAIAALLRGVLALSERRGTFVSAVTHELRTPLTTFRLYTEMLDEGMVPEESARQSYLRALRREADRLGHLVENVLTFARLERGRPDHHRERVTPAELFDRLVPRLAERARRDGMDLLARAAEPAASLHTDLSLVEQILSNLVDNATKYARTAVDRRIHLEAEVAGHRLELTVRDHGPGLSRRASRRLFRPFSKSAHDAAHSAPGVGLGLALSRRIARALGGELQLKQDSPEGACFLLTLPLHG